mgnify:CR=1 FL=1
MPDIVLDELTVSYAGDRSEIVARFTDGEGWSDTVRVTGPLSSRADVDSNLPFIFQVARSCRACFRDKQQRRTA